jgi:4a-hydroxytetrahydrobiopterin dehydratase
MITHVPTLAALAAARDVTVLSAAELVQRLQRLPRWQYRDGALHLGLPCSTMIDGAHLVLIAAKIAEDLNHHPDITLGYQRLHIQITTHDSGGVTALDLAFAARFELSTSAV